MLSTAPNIILAIIIMLMTACCNPSTAPSCKCDQDRTDMTDYSVVCAGEGKRATVGKWGVAAAGLSAKVNVSPKSFAIAGDFGNAFTGDEGEAVVGQYGVARAGKNGLAKGGAGVFATVGEGGNAMVGDGGVARVVGYGGTASAGNGIAYCQHNGEATSASGGISSVEKGKATSMDEGIASVKLEGDAKAGKQGVAVAWNGGRAAAGANGVLVFYYRSGGNVIPKVGLVAPAGTLVADKFYMLDNAGNIVSAP